MSETERQATAELIAAVHAVHEECAALRLSAARANQSARHTHGLLESEREKAALLLALVGEARQLLAGPLVGVEWKRACHSFVGDADDVIKITQGRAS